MPRIEYISRRFSPSSLDLIERANEIIDDYGEQGLLLTLRQLYYCFVAAALIPNNDTEYSRIGQVISNARLAGLIDWDSIEDRGRQFRKHTHWESPEEIMDATVRSYRIDRWSDQPVRVEVWVEKQALEGVIAQACEPLDVPYFACKGYTSQSEMWRASERLRGFLKKGVLPVILHLGDHDPSGLDMTRDIDDRLNVVFGLAQMVEKRIPVHRIALNYDQILRYRPPSNPTKLKDSRAPDYIAQYGHESWELDALEPPILRALIESSIRRYMLKPKRYSAKVDEEATARNRLQAVSDRWEEVEAFVSRPTPRVIPIR